MVVLSIDPGMAHVGWAVCRKDGLVESGTISTEAHDTIADRLKTILCPLANILEAHSPDKVLIEDLNLQFGRKIAGRTVNRKALQMYSAAWGAIFSICFYYCSNAVEFVSLKAIKKGFAQKIALDYINKKRINTHEAEAIVWGLKETGVI